MSCSPSLQQHPSQPEVSIPHPPNGKTSLVDAHVAITNSCCHSLPARALWSPLMLLVSSLFTMVLHVHKVPISPASDRLKNSESSVSVSGIRAELLLSRSEPAAERFGRGADGVELVYLPDSADDAGRLDVRGHRPGRHGWAVCGARLHLLPGGGRPLPRGRPGRAARRHDTESLRAADVLSHLHGEPTPKPASTFAAAIRIN